MTQFGPQFALTTWTSAKALHVNKREENHGDTLVDAMDIRFRIEFINTRLDEWFGRALRHSIYKTTDTMTMEGVPETTPERRTDLIESPLKLKTELVGYMLSIRRGAGHSSLMTVELHGVDGKSFSLDPKPGGTCTLEFTMRASTGLEPEVMGRIASMGGRDVEMMLLPPKLQDGTMPDGHQPPKGKAKPVSPKQLKLAEGTEAKEPADVAPADGADTGDVNPFQFSIRDGQVVDDSPAAGQIPSATELFLGAHAPAAGDLPDDGSGSGSGEEDHADSDAGADDASSDASNDADDHYDAMEAEAGFTGLANDVMPLPRSVAKKVAISTKPRKKV